MVKPLNIFFLLKTPTRTQAIKEFNSNFISLVN